jgi:Cd2+/Zn2+-exporting ATPase
MAHEHLHFKDDVAAEHTHGKQVRVSLALLGTLAGGTLLISSGIATSRFLYGSGSFQADLLAMIGAVLLGAPIVLHAIKSFIKKQMHMDELAALAILAAFANEEYVAAGTIAFFMLLSELVESRTALGARASIESLIKLTPTKANLLANDGSETEVKVANLKPGNSIRVRPGDNIPADGEVSKGLSSVNEATITGESLPVDKVPGMQVFAGTNNLTGVLDIKVTKAGKDTTLGKVQSLIIQAEQTKIPIMRIIDRYVKWYTPTILMIAGIVWFFTQDVNRAITILVISCPCALILATPTAMVAAISASARLGVLIKNVADLEIAGKITALVFDKTGTVTTGRLYVTKLTPAEGVEPGELLAVAASAEQMSKHRKSQKRRTSLCREPSIFRKPPARVLLQPLIRPTSSSAEIRSSRKAASISAMSPTPASTRSRASARSTWPGIPSVSAGSACRIRQGPKRSTQSKSCGTWA